ncbi:MAG: bifunctional phosphopantothenoylcysteine decarboxylase/phosphopantothenate--cysteine ligase CoaBC [Brevundimonas sp.]|uniref:Coenzyme A biosynthesis bifunctional protein CoaBC n=1 Tax=Brevundimonas albigilva TaxID=1312364 RepID=A0ABY4SLV4_9CAUL|nr:MULTISPECIES: bifunctional phosphopantothenoylcysteine decarboxylase/phosphopantothenate--cysteine ligase CoaBC [Brevundimonas]PZU53186.1 MAG: bifunctional phosphopantothenoylcysteine decarboxylase/phosphopantothenate--cysteine ligase CoaBC [Brevundimonas sp.]UQV17286.1 bifunctional phosphopantothenoylcysteine decarboxylase/phosphopantothenate--cysteine ligase CoaBC [Brevundimonas albigilva]URI14884.1 bifunctional phosphopantothenoylcysteine decarboxylase/phosphopantothenate--cysteine ligase 
MDMRPLSNRKVLLIVGGGIAAYKALELVRLIAKAGGETRVILTESGAQFVTPLSLAALSGHPVRSGLFHPDEETTMGHIELSRWADLVVVAPATAGLIAKAANGMADDLASTTLIATDKRVLLAPAMNVRMWLHPAVQANVERLKGFDGFHGVTVVGPDEGEMACGEFGPGRMAEPAAILEAIQGLMAGAAGRPLTGRRAVVTAGPTFEPIDPVRGLTNRSSGKQGYAVAAALAELGCAVTLVSGPTALGAPVGVNRIDVESALEMQKATQDALPADIAVLSAAVADWRIDTVAGAKIKKAPGGPPTLSLVENPDILAGLSRPGRNRPKLVIGFAAETQDLEANARAKLSRKGCDWIVGNDVSDEVFGSDGNTVLLVTASGVETWPRQSKTAIARRLAARIAEQFKDPA